MMKYIELKSGKFIAEHVVSEIGTVGDEIFVQYINGHGPAREYAAANTDPCSIEAVIVALRRRIAEKQE